VSSSFAALTLLVILRPPDTLLLFLTLIVRDFPIEEHAQELKVPDRCRPLNETLKSELVTMIPQAVNEGKAMTKK
jgi:hypothetical protein